jgi:tetrahydromethanopterin S-methyltransferase subunit G
MENNDYKLIGELTQSIKNLSVSVDKLEKKIEDIEKRLTDTNSNIIQKTGFFMGAIAVITILSSFIGFLISNFKGS